MKLTDTLEFQQEDAELYGEPTVSFTFTVRNEQQNELVEREFELANAKEWDTWVLHHYTEKRCSAHKSISQRNWRTVTDVHWNKAHQHDIEIPQLVIDKLDTLLASDNFSVEQ